MSSCTFLLYTKTEIKWGRKEKLCKRKLITRMADNNCHIDRDLNVPCSFLFASAN